MEFLAYMVVFALFISLLRWISGTIDFAFGKPKVKSEEALISLKQAKEKLDLGLISPEEYDKLKSELGKFIK